MALDAWFPVGHEFPDGSRIRVALFEGLDWQIFKVQSEGRVLVARKSLGLRWIQAGLIDDDALREFSYGGQEYFALSSKSDHALEPIDGGRAPENKSDALAFAHALRSTREIDQTTALHDAIYVERFSRLLPTYSLSAPAPDGLVFGTWLTGGVPVSISSVRRLRSLVGWMGESQLREVLERVSAQEGNSDAAAATDGQLRVLTTTNGANTGFALAGRPELEGFLREHVIDIVQNQERYKALGIDFPSAIVLHGPPGCGKTFAIEKLVEYLAWPSFQIDASSVASPYIHDTSKKVAAVFEQAMKNAPSILVIDEMEAFLADRQMGAGSSHHRVEEVAEFLRRIPEAIRNHVLIVAMTNRIEMIDPAILRRGRFDHIVKVDMASQAEVSALLSKLVADLPHAEDIDLASAGEALAGRPLSDVAFVVREAARLAARAGKMRIDHDSLATALGEAAPRTGNEHEPRKIGFV